MNWLKEIVDVLTGLTEDQIIAAVIILSVTAITATAILRVVFGSLFRSRSSPIVVLVALAALVLAFVAILR